MSNISLTFLLFLFACPSLLGATERAPGDRDWDIDGAPAAEQIELDYVVHEGTYISVDVSPNGRNLAFDLAGHIYEMPIDGGSAIALTNGRSWNTNPRYSPDGRLLAFSSDRHGSNDIWVIDRESKALRNLSESSMSVIVPTWSNTGKEVYATAIDSDASMHGWSFALRGGNSPIKRATDAYQPVAQFADYPGKGIIIYERTEDKPYQGGSVIRAIDVTTGDDRHFLTKTGGAFNPTLSPNFEWLVYGNRNDTDTQLRLLNLHTGSDSILVEGMTRDHQDSRAFPYGRMPGVSWSPDSQRLYFSRSGRIQYVDIGSRTVHEIPFRAQIRRSINEAIRFPLAIPEGTTKTTLHRWAHRTDIGILFETLGDIYLKANSRTRQITHTQAHETDPVYSATQNSLYYASWTDADLGSIWHYSLDDETAKKLTTMPTQYGGLALSASETSLAYFRGDLSLGRGQLLQDQTDFELVILSEGKEKVLASIKGIDNGAGRYPLTIRFSPDEDWLYFTSFEEEALALSRIRRDGHERQEILTLPNAVFAVVSPDLQWVAYREYGRSYISPLNQSGPVEPISAHDRLGYSERVDQYDGTYMSWFNAETLGWIRGGVYAEKSVNEILDAGPVTRTEPVSVDFEASAPRGTIAFTGLRIFPMSDAKGGFANDSLHDATVLVKDSRIAAVGTDIDIPDGAIVKDMSGYSVIPGLIDAHGHYDAKISQFNMIERQVPGLLAPLAYGVTSIYELYGNVEKDCWLVDMQRAGRVTGSRLFTVGAPIVGLRYSPKIYRHIDTYTSAKEAVLWNKVHCAGAVKDYTIFDRKRRYHVIRAARELEMNVVSETADDVWMSMTQLVDGVTAHAHTMGRAPLYRDLTKMFEGSAMGISPTLVVVYNGPWGDGYFKERERVWEDRKLLKFRSRDKLLEGKRTGHLWADDHYAIEMGATMKELRDRGVVIAVGGHGQMPGLDVHWEMELLVQSGFSPIEAVGAATISAASLHGLDTEIGSISPGKLADLIFLSKDPSEDIRNARAVAFVMQNGILYDSESMDQIYPTRQSAERMYFLR